MISPYDRMDLYRKKHKYAQRVRLHFFIVVIDSDYL